MRVSVITPTFNSAAFIAAQLENVAAQKLPGLEIEHIVLDPGSTDGTRDILRKREKDLALRLVFEPDHGPADAINRGFAMACGEYVAWLNADDLYEPLALSRACRALERRPAAALCFGHCRIIDASGAEIRRPVTRFKEFWYPFACRPVLQTLNFVSQPATLFRRSAADAAGPLRTDLKAAWDYDFILRLWRRGGAVRLANPPMACFRWTPGSISGGNFRRQFDEELAVATRDAGRLAPQALLHHLVRWGIVAIYSCMTRASIPPRK